VLCSGAWPDNALEYETKGLLIDAFECWAEGDKTRKKEELLPGTLSRPISLPRISTEIEKEILRLEKVLSDELSRRVGECE